MFLTDADKTEVKKKKKNIQELEINPENYL